MAASASAQMLSSPRALRRTSRPRLRPSRACQTEVLLEGNQVEESTVPFAKGKGVAGMLLRGNSFGAL